MHLIEGGTNEEIASATGIRPETAKKYVHRVMLKLGAGSRTQAAVIGAQAGLLQASRRFSTAEAADQIHAGVTMGDQPNRTAIPQDGTKMPPTFGPLSTPSPLTRP